MSGFKLICCQCGSDKVLEKSGIQQLDRSGDQVEYGEGVQRRCLDCSNESFAVYRTWLEESKKY